MFKPTIIEHLCNQILKASSGAYAHSIKDWNFKKLQIEGCCYGNGNINRNFNWEKPQNISSLRGVALSTCVTDRQTDRPKTMSFFHNKFTKITGDLKGWQKLFFFENLKSLFPYISLIRRISCETSSGSHFWPVIPLYQIFIQILGLIFVEPFYLAPQL